MFAGLVFFWNLDHPVLFASVLVVGPAWLGPIKYFWFSSLAFPGTTRSQWLILVCKHLKGRTHILFKSCLVFYVCKLHFSGHISFMFSLNFYRHKYVMIFLGGSGSWITLIFLGRTRGMLSFLGT